MVANQNTIFNKQKGQVCKAMQLILGLIKYYFRQIFIVMNIPTREPKIQNSYYLRHKAMLMSSYLTYNPTDYLALLLIQLVTLDLK